MLYTVLITALIVLIISAYQIVVFTFLFYNSEVYKSYLMIPEHKARVISLETRLSEMTEDNVALRNDLREIKEKYEDTISSIFSKAMEK